MALLLYPPQKEYEKDKLLKIDDVDVLREWIQKQEHLPKLSELELIHFLHSCYYSIERAKTCIDAYYTVRAHCPEFFANRNASSSECQEIFRVCAHATFPKLTPEGYRILYAALSDCDAKYFVLAEQAKGWDMNCTLSMMEDGTANGELIMIDMKGVTIGHVARLGIMTIKKFMYYFQDTKPIRIKGIHVVNCFPLVDKILALVKPFMHKEVADVLYLHKSPNTTLYEYVPQDILPKELGGTTSSIAELKECTKQKMSRIEVTTFFEEEEKQISDESKRIGKPVNMGDIFGTEGTFKKLELD